jgi:hypothetical protein
MPTNDPYQTKLRRQAQRRLGSKLKIRRLRDRKLEGMPDLKRFKGTWGKFLSKSVKLPKSNVAQRFADNVRQDMPKFQASDIPGNAMYLAGRFADQLEKSTIDGITEELDRALLMVRDRAEKQLGQEVPDTKAEQNYVTKLKTYVATQVHLSADKWRTELKSAVAAVTTPESLWRVLVDKEYEVKNDATTAARTLLGDVYNSYMSWLLEKGGGGTYKWVNPLDKHTSEVCKKICHRTAGGVEIDELKTIVREEADKSWYRASSPFLPHPNCRSTMILVRRGD